MSKNHDLLVHQEREEERGKGRQGEGKEREGEGRHGGGGHAASTGGGSPDLTGGDPSWPPALEAMWRLCVLGPNCLSVPNFT